MTYVLLPLLALPDVQGRRSAHGYAAQDLLRLFFGPGEACPGEAVVRAGEGKEVIWAQLDDSAASCLILSETSAAELRPVLEGLFTDFSTERFECYLETLDALPAALNRLAAPRGPNFMAGPDSAAPEQDSAPPKQAAADFERNMAPPKQAAADFERNMRDSERVSADFVESPESSASHWADRVFNLQVLPGDDKKIRARKLKRCLYNALSSLTGKHFPWGSLTGIRPTYVAAELLNSGLDAAAATAALLQDYKLQPGKARLAVDVAQAELAVIRALSPAKSLLYISIPFCPSRCAYCSFSTLEGIAPRSERVDVYLEKLICELSALAEAGLLAAADCLYVGGGTPGILSSAQIEKLFAALGRFISLPQLSEISFEAGRCDVLDWAKLRCLKACGVRRICLNPQSMNVASLLRVNRPAEPESLRLRYAEARNCGFESINMDLIAGLDGETAEEFIAGLDELIGLGPDSVTVHSLALKRASAYAEGYQNSAASPDDAHPLAARLQRPDELVQRMLDAASNRLIAAGYLPYYLYRQKDGIGGLENVGYARPGHACTYNVCMMADSHSVIALGAGAMSKKVKGRRVDRCPAPRSIAVYEQRLASLIERKIAFFSDSLC